MRATPLHVVALHAHRSNSQNGHASTAFSSGNRVLDALPPLDLAGIEDDLEIVTLSAHQFTHSIGAKMHHVDFPIDAVLSVVATLVNGDSVEVGTVGWTPRSSRPRRRERRSARSRDESGA